MSKKLDYAGAIRRFHRYLERLHEKELEPWETSNDKFGFKAGWHARGLAEKKRRKTER